MTTRMTAARKRISEARALFPSPWHRLKYLFAVYWPRLRARLPALPSFIVRVAVAGPGGPATVLVRTNGADWGVLHSIFADREYDVPPSAVGMPRTILDLGANCGYATLFLASRFPQAKLVAVEPLPANATMYRRNVLGRGINATLVEGAVATSDGEGELLLTGNDACESLAPVHDWKDKIRVKTMTVEHLLSAAGWDRVDLLKMDIEGYESQLLADRPGWLSRVGAIVAELHGSYGPAEFRRDLAPFGFSVCQLSDGYEKTWLAFRGTGVECASR